MPGTLPVASGHGQRGNHEQTSTGGQLSPHSAVAPRRACSYAPPRRGEAGDRTVRGRRSMRQGWLTCGQPSRR